jgi:hypothetical protein
MKENHSSTPKELPYDEASLKKRTTRDSSEDWWGCSSIEKFVDQGDLFQTHEDAGGWIAYLERFHPRNFWYQDGNTGIWFWYEDYDNWQDTYGADAVMAVYHSGHGGMDSNGVFYLPMGSNWGGQTTGTSNQMRFGNEQVNYIFFSTCLSLRVLDGHNPIRTWQSSNLGFRMLFGFETVSVDDPNYGRYFWEEWNAGDSLSTAWLDASWRIYNGQAPSVVACGATVEEAQNRLYNERHLSWDHVSSNWWEWRWYYTARTATTTREPNLVLPKELLVGDLNPVDVDNQYVTDITERYGIASKLPEIEVPTGQGAFHLKQEQTRAGFKNDGSYQVQLSTPNLSKLERISLSNAKSIAENSLGRFGLDQDVDLIFDRVRMSYAAGGSAENKGSKIAIEGPYITETTIQFKQSINGLPVVTPGVGEVRVSVDNDGSLTNIQSSTRQVAQLSDHPKSTTSVPEEGGGRTPAKSRGNRFAEPKATDIEGYERLLGEEWRKRLAMWVMSGKMPLHYSTVPGTTEIGYDIRSNEARLVAQKIVEIDFGNGYSKLYKLVAPILE